MIAFEIHRNGERLCVAGVARGALHTILSWSGDQRGKGHGQDQKAVHYHVQLNVAGLEAEGDVPGDHVGWLDQPLTVGDSILVKVIETTAADAPSSREPQDPELVEKQERAYYEHMREKYGDRR